MHFVTVLSCLVAVATAFPQDLPVVRPNHYLAQDTFKKEQHLLPESFFTPAQQVETDMKSISSAIAPEQQSQATQTVQHQVSVPVQKAALVVAPSSSSAESVGDSYANIGGSSGGIASSLTNTNEYGETVPQAFSSLQEDSYAYYHGHKA